MRAIANHMKHASHHITKILYNMMANYTNSNIASSQRIPTSKKRKEKEKHVGTGQDMDTIVSAD